MSDVCVQQTCTTVPVLVFKDSGGNTYYGLFFACTSEVRVYLLVRIHIHVLGDILGCRDAGRRLLHQLLQASRQLLVGLLQPGRQCCCLCQLLLKCLSLISKDNFSCSRG